MPTVLISTPLRRLTGNQSRVDVPGATAGEIIKNLEVGYQAHQAVRLTLADLPAELLNLSLGRGPAVLYVTTATCAQCRLQQAPALARVQQRRPDLQLVQLDAVDQSALADYDHVMTVPTTVVLNAHRRPVAINHGLAGDDRLLAQVNQAAPHHQEA